MNSIAVVDANVIAKTFSDEPDAKDALDFLRFCVTHKIRLVAPELLKYEIIQIAVRKRYSIDKALLLFEQHILSLVELQSPCRSAWLKAELMCQTGHKKSGFPTMYDSIYHAMAIVEGGMFITADRRHYAKSREFEHVVLLQDWMIAFG